jgi:hypothetical protein
MVLPAPFVDPITVPFVTRGLATMLGLVVKEFTSAQSAVKSARPRNQI